MVAVARLEDRDPVEPLGGAVDLVLVRNPGAAFSLATGYTWVLSPGRGGGGGGDRADRAAAAVGGLGGGARPRARRRAGQPLDRIFRGRARCRATSSTSCRSSRPTAGVAGVQRRRLLDRHGGVLLALLALTGRELDGTRVARQHGAKGGAKSMRRTTPSRGTAGVPGARTTLVQGTPQRTDRG